MKNQITLELLRVYRKRMDKLGAKLHKTKPGTMTCVTLGRKMVVVLREFRNKLGAAGIELPLRA